MCVSGAEDCHHHLARNILIPKRISGAANKTEAEAHFEPSKFFAGSFSSKPLTFMAREPQEAHIPSWVYFNFHALVDHVIASSSVRISKGPASIEGSVRVRVSSKTVPAQTTLP